jgi:hypothetical protein
MKLFTLLFVPFLASSAFGVNPSRSVKKSVGAAKPAFRKDSVVASPLFRDPIQVRGGAVPGWAQYNESLDKNPLTTKAMTSLAGWALGDVLAQVRTSRLFILLHLLFLSFEILTLARSLSCLVY